MSESSIRVRQDDEGAGTFDVATDQIGGKDYPIYKVSYGPLGSQTPVSESNPLPISFNESLLASNSIKEELVELNIQMKILNKYMSKWHGEEIKHEDIENDSH